MTRSGYDINGDGKEDVRYETAAEGYYEIRDRNFDGRMDDSTLFDAEDKPVTSRSDDNFDGRMETATVYRQFLPWISYVDTNQNGLFDLVLEYKQGLVATARRYYGNPDQRLIGEYSFEYGYPVGQEKLVLTDMTESEFHELLEPVIEVQ